MGVTLPVPLAPFEELDVQGDSITINVNAKQIIIPTGNQYTLPSYNQWTENPNRCTLEETPWGGLKNSIVQDAFPGSLTIEGDGCFLQTIDGTYTGKTIGAGKLAETSSIVDSGATGITLATADGVELQTEDGASLLLNPPSAIVEEFQVVNISSETIAYTITIKCPDSISSIELFNISQGFNEIINLTQLSKNEYSFSRHLPQNSSESLQLTVIYDSLTTTQQFSADANTTIGLENMAESWIAWLPKSGSDIIFIHFSERPKSFSCKQNTDGTISQITIYPGNGALYHGRIIHSDHTRVTGSGYVPDCLNKQMHGSITKFLQSHGMNTTFPSNTKITTWVVPAISDTKILPMSEMSDSLLSDIISLRMCAGERGCASFVVNSNRDINLEFVATNLTNDENSISSENIDLNYVKCWWQYGYGETGLMRGNPYLTPELLVHDQTLIHAEASENWKNFDMPNKFGKNYLKLAPDNYIDISVISNSPENARIIPISERNFVDANKLTSINISNNENSQFWIALNIPDDTKPGVYSGILSIKSCNVLLKQINLSITILPITLLPSNIEYSVYYRGQITADGSISSEYKTVEQFTAEQLDMVAHGVTVPNLYNQHSNDTLIQALQIRQQCGIDNTNLYYVGLSVDSSIDDIIACRDLVSQYGVQQLYIYGKDESDLTSYKTKIDEIHAVNVKIFCAQSYAQAALIADKLDLAIISFAPDPALATTYHSYSSFDGAPHKIFSYQNPQTIPEYPRTFRLNYGLRLSKDNYNGTMDYAYQHSFGDVWNDFDSTSSKEAYRDHVFAYPTANGVIDTVQWEGLREAVNDMRYLATLQAAITEANNLNIVVIDIDSWLETLKTTDLANSDLDAIRSQMIDSILEIQKLEQITENYLAILTADGNPIIFGDNTQLFLEV